MEGLEALTKFDVHLAKTNQLMNEMETTMDKRTIEQLRIILRIQTVLEKIEKQESRSKISRLIAENNSLKAKNSELRSKLNQVDQKIINTLE